MNGTMPKEEINQIRDFLVDFRLNDEGDLESAEFGESCLVYHFQEGVPSPARGNDRCANHSIQQHYSRKQSDGPQSSGGGTNALAQGNSFTAARNRGGENTARADMCL